MLAILVNEEKKIVYFLCVDRAIKTPQVFFIISKFLSNSTVNLKIT